MRLSLEVSGQYLLGLYVISTAILVQKLIITCVRELRKDVIFDEIAEIWHSFCSYAVCAINGPVDGILPP
jgi:hypothetical protein